MKDLLAGDAGFFGKEWRIADEHLEEDDAEGPPVDGFGVAFLTEDLRGYVVWGADG